MLFLFSWNRFGQQAENETKQNSFMSECLRGTFSSEDIVLKLEKKKF